MIIYLFSLHGVLVGFANGSIWYIPDHDVSKSSIMAAQLQVTQNIKDIGTIRELMMEILCFYLYL
jgi:hypothetical protein